MENITHNNEKSITFIVTEEVKETLAITTGLGQLRQEFAKSINQKDMTLKKTNLEITGRANFASVGGSAFRKKTNTKAKSVYERIHKVSNYHYYAIYKARTEPL